MKGSMCRWWISITVAFITMLAAILVIPEFRQKLGLHTDFQKQNIVETPISGNNQGKLNQEANVTSSPGAKVYQKQVIVVHPLSKSREREQSAPRNQLPHEQQHVPTGETIKKVVERLSSRIEDFFYQTDKKVVVLDFVDQKGDVTTLGPHIAEAISNELANIARGFKVQDRNQVLAALGKPIPMPALLNDHEKRKLIMNRTGIDSIVYGTIVSLGQDLDISCKAVEVETGNILFSSDVIKVKTQKTN